MLTPAQDLIEILPRIEQTMEILVVRGRLGKTSVVVSDEAGQEGVCRIDRTDAGEPQLLHQAILQRMMCAFDAPLCLTGIGAEKLDVELR